LALALLIHYPADDPEPGPLTRSQEESKRILKACSSTEIHCCDMKGGTVCIDYGIEKREGEKLEIDSIREWRYLRGILSPLPSPDMQHILWLNSVSNVDD